MNTIDEIRAELRAYSECQSTDKTSNYCKWNGTMNQVYEFSQGLKKIREKTKLVDSPMGNPVLFVERDRYEDFFKRILDLSASTNDYAHLLNLIGEENKEFQK